MSALHRGSMSMTVKDYGGKWGSPNPPSSPCSGAVIPQGIAGRAIETHYCWNHVASKGCKLPGKWMEHTGGVGGGGGFSLSTICIDTCDLFLIFWLHEIWKRDLIKFRLGRILRLSSTLKLWNHPRYSCEFRENCSLGPSDTVSYHQSVAFSQVQESFCNDTLWFATTLAAWL